LFILIQNIDGDISLNIRQDRFTVPYRNSHPYVCQLYSAELLHLDSSRSFAGDNLVVDSAIPVDATALENATVLETTDLADGSVVVRIPSTQQQQHDDVDTSECTSSPGR
jgi:hypothetical protein